jgi:hypothetical protein
MKILAVLVNYGKEQLTYLNKVVAGLKSFDKYTCDIIVNSNIPLTNSDIDKVNVIQLSDYQLLPLTCRKTIWENRDDYDVFIFGENDHRFKEIHIDRFLEYVEILPDDRVAGLIQYEENQTGKYYPAYHAHYDWDYNSVEVYNGKQFAHFTNLHQASFILTKEQLLKIGDMYDFSTFFKGKSPGYSVKCMVNTDIYQHCGMKKVICISEFEDNIIHHLPNLYIKGIRGRNKNQRSDDTRMQKALSRLLKKN